MFMLDLLDRLPRLRLSDDHLKTVIWVMRECRTPSVPTFTELRKLQKKLKDEIGVVPKHHVSPLGNHYYTNHPAKLELTGLLESLCETRNAILPRG